MELFKQALRRVQAAVMINVDFSRPLLALTKAASAETVATDLQTVCEGSREYGADFFEVAHIVFMSHEKLPVGPEDFVSTIGSAPPLRSQLSRWCAAGALLCVRDRDICRVSAVQVGPVVNTAGAGDALFSCFLHFYLDGDEPILALGKPRYSPPTK